MDCPFSKLCEMECKKYFLLLTRVFFGIWLGYLGVGKVFIMGIGTFNGYILKSFEKTWIPEFLVSGSGYLIALGELFLGIWLLSGLKQRSAWTLTALLMFLLTFGQTVLMDNALVANNWQYLVLAIVCAAIADNNRQICCQDKK